MREEIPQWNWYNGLFLWAFEDELKSHPDKSIQQFFVEFKHRNGLTRFPFSLKNQGAVLSLLYALLVVPREIWERDTGKTSFAFTSGNEFTVTTGRYRDVWDFLRLMRNAISHANFHVDIDNQTYRFWNIEQGIKSFEVEVTHEGIGRFLTEVGKYYINGVKAQQAALGDPSGESLLS